MMSLLKKISAVRNNRTTYRVGLLQAKAYRILKQQTTEALKPFGISTIEWAFLGVLVDSPHLRAREVALELGVEPPFVTVMSATLSKKGLLRIVRHDEDSRIKVLSLTAAGKAFVATTEVIVRQKMRPLIAGASIGEVLGYLSILEGIVAHGTRKKKSAPKK